MKCGWKLWGCGCGGIRERGGCVIDVIEGNGDIRNTLWMGIADLHRVQTVWGTVDLVRKSLEVMLGISWLEAFLIAVWFVVALVVLRHPFFVYELDRMVWIWSYLLSLLLDFLIPVKGWAADSSEDPLSPIARGRYERKKYVCTLKMSPVKIEYLFRIVDGCWCMLICQCLLHSVRENKYVRSSEGSRIWRS